LDLAARLNKFCCENGAGALQNNFKYEESRYVRNGAGAHAGLNGAIASTPANDPFFDDSDYLFHAMRCPDCALRSDLAIWIALHL
jgi:hypothetical protein